MTNEILSRQAGEPVDGGAVQRDLLLAFEYAHNEDDWVFPLADALAGLTAREAAWIPDSGDPEARSIWRIVLHMTVWTENIVQRMGQRERGERPGGPPEGAWPPLPPTQGEDAWADTQRRLWDAVAALRAHIAGTPPAALLDPGDAGYTQFADLLCRFVHNAYHIGQITKMRDWMAQQRTLADRMAEVLGPPELGRGGTSNWSEVEAT